MESSLKQNIRKDILSFEEKISNIEGSFKGDTDNCPLKHSFADGIYVREIFIPAGMFIVGKIHKHSHPNFLMSGEVEVITESGGKERIVAPCSMISVAGTKRALYTIKDCVWVTVHENYTNTRNLKELEDFIIAKDYVDYQKFIDKKYSILNKIKNFVNLKINIP